MGELDASQHEKRKHDKRRIALRVGLSLAVVGALLYLGSKAENRFDTFVVAEPITIAENMGNTQGTYLPEFDGTTVPLTPTLKIIPGSISESDLNNTDTDGDGLWDTSEEKLGTDPNNSDTDGDGKSDYHEFIHGTNPFSIDNSLRPLSEFDWHFYRADPRIEGYNAVVDNDMSIIEWLESNGILEDEVAINLESLTFSLYYYGGDYPDLYPILLNNYPFHLELDVNGDYQVFQGSVRASLSGIINLHKHSKHLLEMHGITIAELNGIDEKEIIPMYNPEWNMPKYVKSNTCYGYALNRPIHPDDVRIFMPAPGSSAIDFEPSRYGLVREDTPGASANAVDYFTLIRGIYPTGDVKNSCNVYSAGVEADGFGKILCDETCPGGSHKISLQVFGSDGRNYDFAREEKDGWYAYPIWSLKTGSSPAINTNDDGQPLFGVEDILEMSRYYDYKLCGCFCASNNPAEIDHITP